LKGLDLGVERFVAWLSLALVSSFLLYSGVISTFAQLLNGRLVDTFGTVFPAFPFVTLLFILFALRWNELHAILLKEHGLTSKLPIRVLGLCLVVLPLAFRQLSESSLELSAVTLISVFYGSSLLINPLSLKIMLPYALLYSVGVTSPAILQAVFGEPLAGFSSALTAGMVSLSGIPVTWHGTQFEFVSKLGETVTATITPGCSSVLSVTTFVGLLGLMHIDLKKEPRSTIKVALVGVAALTVLNSLRIGILIWAGYANGEAALWGLHNWIGYALFLGFYLATLVIYTNMGKRSIMPASIGIVG
jgi:exosortase/archaeosortase family protein